MTRPVWRVTIHTQWRETSRVCRPWETKRLITSSSLFFLTIMLSLAITNGTQSSSVSHSKAAHTFIFFFCSSNSLKSRVWLVWGELVTTSGPLLGETQPATDYTIANTPIKTLEQQQDSVPAILAAACLISSSIKLARSMNRKWIRKHIEAPPQQQLLSASTLVIDHLLEVFSRVEEQFRLFQKRSSSLVCVCVCGCRSNRPDYPFHSITHVSYI